MNPINKIGLLEPENFEATIRPKYAPVVVRGAAADWPIVQAGGRSTDEALSLIERMGSRAQTEVMLVPPEEKGRFFYRHDMRGFNFKKVKATLGQVAAHLRLIAKQDKPIGIYAGATSLKSHVPGFIESHPIPLTPQDGSEALIWLGNATQIATHFDLSDNFAIVAHGTRRFTLFPPEATKHLYVGPLNETLAGQPVSMVDPVAPDRERYPEYGQAEELALVATLHPGDLIYIPKLWWHHVQAVDPVNILVNHWHNDVSHGGGFLALVHSMLAIRELPQPEKEAWREWFDHFVFGPDAGNAADHLPLHARGINGPSTPDRNRMIRDFLVRVLSR